MKARAPIVKALNLSKEKIQQIKHIMATEVQTKRKDKLREAMDGLPLCTVCSEIPTYSVIYPLEGLTRRESYCDACFDNVYQKTKDVDIHTIAERWNCTIAEPDSMKKIQGYNEVKPKSMSSHTITCNKCGFRITFDQDQKGPQGRPIPLDLNGQIHNCGITYSFPCRMCDEQIYLDRKVLSPTGKRIPLSAIDSRPHDCMGKKSDRNRNIDDV